MDMYNVITNSYLSIKNKANVLNKQGKNAGQVSQGFSYSEYRQEEAERGRWPDGIKHSLKQKGALRLYSKISL